MKVKKIVSRVKLSLLMLIAFPLLTSAQEKELDVKKMVLEHISDSYSWHIGRFGDKDVSIHLPIIVCGNNSGWQVFSSAHVSHGHSYNGFTIAEEGRYAGKLVEVDANGNLTRPKIDISLTKNAVGLLIGSIVVLLIVMSVARWYKKGTMSSPKGFRGLVEMVIVYVNDEVIKPSIGEDDYRKYSPFLLTLFFFILVNNLLGLIPIFPGGANVTGNITVTLVLAVSTFLVVNFSGSKHYWKEILWPDVPTWLKVPIPLMPLIEILGMFTKPFALTIRLFANMFAGHAVIVGLTAVIFITASMGVAINSSMSFVSVIFSVFMLCLKLLVSLIQAYVFTLLSSVFIGMARAKH